MQLSVQPELGMRHHLALGQAGQPFARHQSFLQSLAPHQTDIDAPAVIGHLDDHRTVHMARTERERSMRGLAELLAVDQQEAQSLRRAKQLGRADCASVLQKTLDEEKATDKKLTTLAESKVNRKAA